MDILSLLSRASDIGRPGARNILPVASLVLLVAGLVAAGAPKRYPNIHSALLAAQHLSVIGFGLLVLTIVAFSIFLQPVITGLVAVLQDKVKRPLIIRLLQPLRFRAMRGVEVRRQKLRVYYREMALKRPGSRTASAPPSDINDMAEEVRQFPSITRVRATRLGNILAAAEENAGRPYGLDARVALPRLELLMPDSAKKQLSSLRDDCLFASRFCATLILAILFSGALLWGDGIWLVIPAVAVAFAWLSYRNAVAAAVPYAEMLRVVFDLYRFLLYVSYNLEVPKSLFDEQQMGYVLSQFMQVGSFPIGDGNMEWHY